MTAKRHNTQMFALRCPPPQRITVAGREYMLVRVFKHDFWAATCLYEASVAADYRRIVVKFGRSQAFWGLPLGCYARLLLAHERDIYTVLAGVEGVPRWAGEVGREGFAIEYVQADPLDHLERPPEGFFERLRDLFDAIHARGVAYCDANKRSNILVAADGRPYLVDFQIAVRRQDDWPWPLRPVVAAAVRYLAAKDLYHLYKHKRRLAPHELTSDEDALSRRRSGLHRLHRKLTKPYRGLRRWFLRRQYAKGALQSPTAELEDHHQPEKDSWRK